MCLSLTFEFIFRFLKIFFQLLNFFDKIMFVFIEFIVVIRRKIFPNIRTQIIVLQTNSKCQLVFLRFFFLILFSAHQLIHFSVSFHSFEFHSIALSFVRILVWMFAHFDLVLSIVFRYLSIVISIDWRFQLVQQFVVRLIWFSRQKNKIDEIFWIVWFSSEHEIQRRRNFTLRRFTSSFSFVYRSSSAWPRSRSRLS